MSSSVYAPHQQCRGYRTSWYSNKKKKKDKKKKSKRQETLDNMSEAAGRKTVSFEDRDVEGSRFPLPDKDKEDELRRTMMDMQDLYRQGDFAAALKEGETLLEATKAHFGHDHPATASAYNSIGVFAKMMGDFDTGRQSYEAAKEIYAKTIGTNHENYATTIHNLGLLSNQQVHLDEELDPDQRLVLAKQAGDDLQRAYEIRKVELGKEHPHTVASLSSWGSCLVSNLMRQYKKSESSYVSVLPENEQEWAVAEEYLNEALETAVQNPRGRCLADADVKQSPPSRDDGATIEGNDAANNKIQTLSAASAAQNLAVYYKVRATTTTTAEDNDAKKDDRQRWLDQSLALYKQVLHVRSQLLSTDHPDIAVTKHSLAELLAAIGDEEAANAIRQEILDTYSPEDDDGSPTINYSTGGGPSSSTTAT